MCSSLTICYVLIIIKFIYISFVTTTDEVTAYHRRTAYTENFEMKSEVNIATTLDLLTSPSFFLVCVGDQAMFL